LRNRTEVHSKKGVCELERGRAFLGRRGRTPPEGGIAVRSSPKAPLNKGPSLTIKRRGESRDNGAISSEGRSLIKSTTSPEHQTAARRDPLPRSGNAEKERQMREGRR